MSLYKRLQTTINNIFQQIYLIFCKKTINSINDVFNNYRTTLMILEYSGFQVKPPPRTVFAVIIYSFPVGFVDRIDELKGLPEFKEPPKPFEIE
ncbi:MAG: hypothetical protein WC401_05575 [Bacteroidales bacterium]|jgi:hypothetical protein